MSGGSAGRMRVVVTGVAGFIGSNLAERLVAEGHTVVGLDDLSQGVPEQVPAEVEFHRADIRTADEGLYGGAAAVFHLAAKNCIPDCQREPVETMSINVAGTAAVLECARRAGVRRVIYAESSALYEGSTVFPTPEEVLAPRSFYAVSKAAAREVAAAYERHHGMVVTALRYFCVYGPRQDYRRTVPPVMSAFILRLLRGERPVIYGTGEKRRDFVYIDDVNDFHVQCLTDARTVGRTFNLGSGRDHSVHEIYQQIRRLVGGGPQPVYASDQPGEADRTCADITRARSLGWSPRVTLEEGLARSLTYIRANVLRESATQPA